MNPRSAHWAVTALTALTTAGALQAAVNSSDGSARPIVSASAPAIARFLVEHQQPINIANLVVSASLLIWWLMATAKPTHRPALRLANAAFGSWVLVQMILIWAAVLGVLQQVSGLPDQEPLTAALRIIEATRLKWLIPASFSFPFLQIGLGEWAYHRGACSARIQATQPIASAQAG
ncbi:hypothetical protein [Stutzerimonas stutzeri]|uniref:hypothetical protein n=1 Tax=Stutzerimonas stutzeri TaxID=316 RepID=UPI003DA03C3D